VKAPLLVFVLCACSSSVVHHATDVAAAPSVSAERTSTTNAGDAPAGLMPAGCGFEAYLSPWCGDVEPAYAVVTLRTTDMRAMESALRAAPHGRGIRTPSRSMIFRQPTRACVGARWS
jgi:hypothetical protein